ncbi:MAG: aldehyde dehydrogenase family protein, partial [Sinomicrobium sp.]|nr:aldehyde dehydrogenase family protein [Sinomicrobium sp.]
MTDTLTNKDLFVDKTYIGGKWRGAHSFRTFEVTNPATGEIIGAVPDLTDAETHEAVTAAGLAFGKWSAFSATERARLLKKWHALMIENADDLARILTMEQGKPLDEARSEILYGASFVEWFAEEARRIYGDVIPGHTRDTRIVVIKQPIGVVGAITPWNFPNAMITRKIAPALAAGCTVVV